MTHSMSNSSVDSAQKRVDELNKELIGARAAKTLAVSVHGAAKVADKHDAAIVRADAEACVAELTDALNKAKADLRAARKAAKDDAKAPADMSGPAERLRARYVYCALRNEVWDRSARDWLSLQALDNLETVNMPSDDKGRRIQPWSVLRVDPRADRVHNERYMPGVEDEIATADGVNWLNLWKAPSVKPAKGDAQPMLDHVFYLCNGKKDQADHVLDQLAFMVQRPGEKMNHATLLISQHQGVGKDTLGDAMMRIIGESNVALVQDEAVADGRFHFMKASQLVIVPEIMSGDRKDIANKLKPLITQPTIEVNEKHLRPYTIRNTTNFFFFSNHEAAAHIEDHDRRYFVVICKQKPRSADYYTALHTYIAGPEISGFAHFLATRDLSQFKPKAPAPWTDDKKTVQQATKGGVEAWLDDAYESQAAPFHGHLINLRDALGKISQFDGAPRMTIQQLSGFLKKKGALDMGPQRVGQGNAPVRVWAIKDAEAVVGMPIEALRTLYNKPISGAPIVGLAIAAE